MSWLIWDKEWVWNNNFSKSEAMDIKLSLARQYVFYSYCYEKNLKNLDKEKITIRTLKNTHTDRLPFLKKKVYDKLWKNRGPNSRVGGPGGYWDWRHDLYYQKSDVVHPRRLWKNDKIREADNLVVGSTFYSNEEKKIVLRRWKFKKKYRGLRPFLRNIENHTLFNDFGWQGDWFARRKKIRGASLKLLIEAVKTKKFKSLRKKNNIKKAFRASTENQNFWGLSWWTKSSKAEFELWNNFKFINEKITFARYVDVNCNLSKKKNSLNMLIKRASAKFLVNFYKKIFKVLFFKKWEALKLDGNFKTLQYSYKSFKSEYWLFFTGLKNFLLKTAVRPAAYLLSNAAFTTIMYDRLNLSLGYRAISFERRHNAFYPKKKSIGSSYSADVSRSSSRAVFSNYFKINNYVFLRYLLYLISNSTEKLTASDEKKNTKFINLFRFVSACTKKKYKNYLNLKKITKITRGPSTKKSKSASKVFIYGLAVFKHFFLEAAPSETFKNIWFRPVRASKERLLKLPPKLLNRGPFFYIRKKIPKWYKSNKQIRLFRRFVRNFSVKKKKTSYKLTFIAGRANKYFKVTSCKKYFKQKIFIRAKFLDHYRGPSLHKMNNRWKNIQKARHKWHGFYKEFEGNLLRASLWAGFSNKYKLSKFLIENDLIFLNGGAPKKLGVNSRQPVKKNDILYLRRDIADNIKFKRELKLFKKYLGKYPFYNKLLKAKILFRSSKILKAYLMGRQRYKRKHIHTNVVDFLKKEYIARADSTRGVGLFEGNQPNVSLLHRKEKWHKKIKNLSTFKFIKFIQKNNFVFSSSAEHCIDPGSESFLLKTDYCAMLTTAPISVNNFFYGTDQRFKKMINPRTVKYFSERRFNY